MERKLIALAVVGLSLVGLTGCTAPHSEDDPAIIGEGSWELEYVIINQDDGVAIPCLWNGRSSGGQTFDCDWDSQSSVIPEGALSNIAGEGGWEIEYVAYDGKTVPCLWNARNEPKYSSFSCDFD